MRSRNLYLKLKPICGKSVQSTISIYLYWTRYFPGKASKLLATLIIQLQIQNTFNKYQSLTKYSFEKRPYKTASREMFLSNLEGREGVKWELGFAFFRGWEMGFCALGLGFMKKKR